MPHKLMTTLQKRARAKARRKYMRYAIDSEQRAANAQKNGYAPDCIAHHYRQANDHWKAFLRAGGRFPS